MIPLPPLFFALVLMIVDGDSVRMRIPIWPQHYIETSIRIAGIDTPEIHGACSREKKLAVEAKEALARLLPLNALVELRHIEIDKYGNRVGAEVRTLANLDVAGHLMKIGLAHSYAGKKKRGWC